MSKAKWQKQLRVHLEQLNYAGAGFAEAQSTLIHSVAFLFKWPLPESPLCQRCTNAPLLEQNLSCIAANEVSLLNLNDSRRLPPELCVLSHWKRILNHAIQPGPLKPAAFICTTIDWCVVGPAVVNSNFYLLPAATAQVPGEQRAAGPRIWSRTAHGDKQIGFSGWTALVERPLTGSAPPQGQDNVRAPAHSCWALGLLH